MSCSISWEAISAIGSAVAAIAAAVTVIAQGCQQRKARAVSIHPYIVFNGVKTDGPNMNPNEKRGYAVHVNLHNSGNGTATIMAVKGDSNDMPRCDIGSFLVAGADDNFTITIFLPSNYGEYNLKYSIYYWDIEERSFVTSIDIRLSFSCDEEKRRNNQYLDHGLNNQHATKTVKKLPIPKRPQFWDNGTCGDGIWEKCITKHPIFRRHAS